MNRALVVAVAAGMLLAGCTPTAPVRPEPTTSASPTRFVTPSPVPAPSRLPGEIARTVLAPDTNSAVVDDVPRGTRVLYVHVVCTGPQGSALRYQVQDGDAEPFGVGGEVDCDGTTSVAGGAVSSPPPAAQVHVEADRGVQGWAVLSTSAEGAG